jgi:CheY-like chemotaxis protein
MIPGQTHTRQRHARLQGAHSALFGQERDLASQTARCDANIEIVIRVFPSRHFTIDTPEIRGAQARVFGAGSTSLLLRRSSLGNEPRIRVLAVDHNALLREGISLLIGLQADMELVCLVGSAAEAVKCFAEHRPDVILMDLDLPSGAGISAIQKILRLSPAVSIIGLLTYEWDAAGPSAQRAGARAWLTKDRLNDDLISLIRDESARRRSQ